MSNSGRRKLVTPSRFTMARDVISFALGWLLIFQQALQPEKFHVAFLLLAALATGVPAMVAAASTIVTRMQVGIPLSSTPALPSVSSSSSTSHSIEDEQELTGDR